MDVVVEVVLVLVADVDVLLDVLVLVLLLLLVLVLLITYRVLTLLRELVVVLVLLAVLVITDRVLMLVRVLVAVLVLLMTYRVLILVREELLLTAGASPSHLPHAAWHPLPNWQYSSPTPQNPKAEQQAPHLVPAHVMPLPQVPSVLAPVLVGATEIVVLVGTAADDGDDEGDDEAGPARYQFDGGSPRHSPTVTAR